MFCCSPEDNRQSFVRLDSTYVIERCRKVIKATALARNQKTLEMRENRAHDWNCHLGVWNWIITKIGFKARPPYTVDDVIAHYKRGNLSFSEILNNPISSFCSDEESIAACLKTMAEVALKEGNARVWVGSKDFQSLFGSWMTAIIQEQGVV